MSIPEVFFRETIDLNRYSNAVANKFVENYIQVIYSATQQLIELDKRQKKAGVDIAIAPQTRKRLRAIIAQSKASMDRWSKDATKQMIKEMEGLAKIQTGFIEGELQKAVKSGGIPINSVAVNQRYATSFVNRDFVSSRLQPQEITSLLTLFTAGTITQETLLNQLSAGEVLGDDFDVEEEIEGTQSGGLTESEPPEEPDPEPEEEEAPEEE